MDHSHPTADASYTLLLQLGFRITFSLAMNFVLCWLVLRSGSILPLAITHTVYNLQGRPMIEFALWGVAAFAPYHYWPIPFHNRAVPIESEASLQAIIPAFQREPTD